MPGKDAPVAMASRTGTLLGSALAKSSRRDKASSTCRQGKLQPFKNSVAGRKHICLTV